jgi:hypothetical protein
MPTDPGRWYEGNRPGPDGQPARLVSVTNVTDAIDKPALIRWAANGAVAETFDRLPEAVRAQRIRPCNAPTIKGRCGRCPQCLARHLAAWHARESEDAKSRGAAVHDAKQFWILWGTWPPIKPEHQPYLDSFRQFTEDYGLTPGSWELTEATVFNYTHGYGGTLDGILDINASATVKTAQLVARITGWPHGTVRLVEDTKTRKGPGKQLYSNMALQLSAYRNAEVWTTADNQEHSMYKTDGAVVLQLRPDGYSFDPVDAGERTFQAFLGYKQGRLWDLESGTRSVGVTAFPMPDEVAGTKAAIKRVSDARKAATTPGDTQVATPAAKKPRKTVSRTRKSTKPTPSRPTQTTPGKIPTDRMCSGELAATDGTLPGIDDTSIPF